MLLFSAKGFYPVDPVWFDSCWSKVNKVEMFLGQYGLRIFTPPVRQSALILLKNNWVFIY